MRLQNARLESWSKHVYIYLKTSTTVWPFSRLDLTETRTNVTLIRALPQTKHSEHCSTTADVVVKFRDICDCLISVHR